MVNPNHQKYCSVFGCLNSSSSAISFFKIPPQRKRRLQWLKLIGREDLISKNTFNYVCQIHFNDEDIKINTFRKTLPNYALPCFHLPNPGLFKEDKQTQTEKGQETQFTTNWKQNVFENLSAPPPPQQQQQFIVDAQPGTSSAAPTDQNDLDFEIDECEVGVITEQETKLEDPLANNSNQQCRFCAKNANNCIYPADQPYSKDNKITLTLNDIHVEIDLNDTHIVCLHCDRKFLEMFNFVGMVKNAQDTLLNASFGEETETLVVKTECESPTPDGNDEINDKINEDAKEEIVDSITIDETVVKDVFTHKKRKCNRDTKLTIKRQKKPVEDIKITTEDTELIMDIKEEPIEKDDDATYIHKSANSEDNTGPDDKPSELDIATNALLNEMADDGFS